MIRDTNLSHVVHGTSVTNKFNFTRRQVKTLRQEGAVTAHAFYMVGSVLIFVLRGQGKATDRVQIRLVDFPVRMNLVQKGLAQLRRPFFDLVFQFVLIMLQGILVFFHF